MLQKVTYKSSLALWWFGKALIIQWSQYVGKQWKIGTPKINHHCHENVSEKKKKKKKMMKIRNPKKL